MKKLLLIGVPVLIIALAVAVIAGGKRNDHIERTDIRKIGVGASYNGTGGQVVYETQTHYSGDYQHEKQVPTETKHKVYFEPTKQAPEQKQEKGAFASWADKVRRETGSYKGQ